MVMDSHNRQQSFSSYGPGSYEQGVAQRSEDDARRFLPTQPTSWLFLADCSICLPLLGREPPVTLLGRLLG